jgi:arylsulfatase A-like enzyme
MIRKGKYKYVYHSPPDDKHPAEHELYDLEADPGEFNNLAKKPENKALSDSLLAELVKEIGEHPDETEKRCRAQTAAGYGGEKGEKGKGKGKNKKNKNAEERGKKTEEHE